VSLKARVTKLEQRSGVADGLCPRCGGGPHDVRLVIVGRHPGGAGADGAEGPPGPGWQPAPPPPLCSLCGLPLPPLRIVDEAADGSLWIDARDKPWRGVAPEGPETAAEASAEEECL
jgi:hypothetical protein